MANPVVIPQSEWLAMLDALTAVSAPWNGSKVGLFKAPTTINDRMILTDLTPCDFTGYALSAAVTWAAAAYRPDGTAVVAGDAKTFAVGATPTILNTVYGWYLVDGGGTDLQLVRLFDTPIVLSGPLQQLTVLPAYAAYLSS